MRSITGHDRPLNEEMLSITYTVGEQKKLCPDPVHMLRSQGLCAVRVRGSGIDQNVAQVDLQIPHYGGDWLSASVSVSPAYVMDGPDWVRPIEHETGRKPVIYLWRYSALNGGCTVSATSLMRRPVIRGPRKIRRGPKYRHVCMWMEVQ